MLAVTYDEYGDPSVLKVAEVPEPHAAGGQVRIAVRAAGVNPLDWKVRSGAMRDMMPVTFPMVPGGEAAGVVDEVGDGVDGVAVGDEVFGLGSATSAQFAVLDHVAHKPAEVSWEQAAGMATAAETARRALDLLDLSPGKTLLIDGAAGGVGTAATQLAVAAGVQVVGTASGRNQDHLRSLGAVATTYGPGLADRVAGLAPGGVDRALDVAGQGSLAELVALTGSPDSVLTIADFSAAEHGVRVTTEMSAFAGLEQAAQLAHEGRYVVAVDSGYPFAGAAEAHARSEAGHVTGKIVLTAPAEQG